MFISYKSKKKTILSYIIIKLLISWFKILMISPTPKPIPPKYIYPPLSYSFQTDSFRLWKIMILYETCSITSSRSVNYHSCLSNITLLLTCTYLNLSTVSPASLLSLYHLSPFLHSLSFSSLELLLFSFYPLTILFSSIYKPFFHPHTPWNHLFILFC